MIASKSFRVFKPYNTLNEVFDKLGNNYIRVFCNCQTIFCGRRLNMSDNEWNLMIRPYLNCKVIDSFTNNGVIVVLI